ncbi:hypothetical protein GCM10010420_18260 [Streptomyces glaucosporus]|uniref:Uncharacterized protein n=1 Tax=Streptomyces glaucosporus TaxID=284044 RepID=A0ABN3I348_9ACTN
MTNRSALALAFTTGYALGRVTKFKLPLGMGALALGRRLGVDPGRLGERIGGTVPALSGVSGRLRDTAGKAGGAAAGGLRKGARGVRERLGAVSPGSGEETGGGAGTGESASGEADSGKAGGDGAAAGGTAGGSTARRSPARRTAARTAKKTAGTSKSTAKSTKSTAGKARKTAGTAGKTAPAGKAAASKRTASSRKPSSGKTSSGKASGTAGRAEGSRRA